MPYKAREEPGEDATIATEERYGRYGHRSRKSGTVIKKEVRSVSIEARETEQDRIEELFKASSRALAEERRQRLTSD